MGLKQFAEFDEFLHALVAAGEQSLAGPVPVNHRTRPASETARAATGRAGVDLDGAFAARGAGIELVQRAVVAAPRVGILKQIGPDLFRGQELNGIGHPDARQVRVAVQAVARLAARHGLRAGGAFGAARAEMEDGFALMADALLHEVVDGIDLHALRTPAEGAVGRRIKLAKRVRDVLKRRHGQRRDYTPNLRLDCNTVPSLYCNRADPSSAIEGLRMAVP